MKKRFVYACMIILIIILGLLSRQVKAVPLWAGDVLYATMMYFLVRFILIHKRSGITFTVSLCICFLIEFSQLYQDGWINKIRSTLPGRLILGQGFLWSDLAAYMLGAAIGLIIDHLLNKK